MRESPIPRHVPVLPSTALSLLRPEPGDTVLDATLGLAGHASLITEKIGETGVLIGLDADTENLALARERLKDAPCTVRLHHANFRNIAALNLPPVNIVFADLGVSSPHFDDPERGFSFRFDAPLDLRFDRSAGQTARELIRAADEESLGRIFALYGELAGSYKLARALAGKDYVTTADLRAIVERVFGYRAPSVLPRIFQALRIAVNEELEALEILLKEAPKLLLPGGRLGIISFHSLEDRMVKQHFKRLCTPEKDPITGQIVRQAAFGSVTKKPALPSAEEIEENPRARSAKFRVIERL